LQAIRGLDRSELQAVVPLRGLGRDRDMPYPVPEDTCLEAGVPGMGHDVMYGGAHPRHRLPRMEVLNEMTIG